MSYLGLCSQIFEFPLKIFYRKNALDLESRTLKTIHIPAAGSLWDWGFSLSNFSDYVR